MRAKGVFRRESRFPLPVFHKKWGIEGKRRVGLHGLNELPLLHPELPLNGGVTCTSSEVLFDLFIIERKLGNRVVYLKFEGFGFGWASLVDSAQSQTA